MKKVLSLLLLFSGLVLSAQSFDFKFDHYSFIVKDLKTTGNFYAEVLQLKEIPHPSAKQGFRWFIINANSQLHLIGKDSVPEQKSKSAHLCLAVADLEAFIRYLEKLDVAYWDWAGKKNSISLRADGVRQIYLKDPENNWVEINTAEH